MSNHTKRFSVSWCTSPNREYARDLQDLDRMGARCDAWRAFMSSPTLRRLHRLRGHFIWFNQYECFDKLIAEFSCTEKRLRAVIREITLPEFRDESFVFKRADIYDARAWAGLPLNWFVAGLDGFAARDSNADSRFQQEVLPAHQVPVIQFGIKLPVILERRQFRMTHRIKHEHRFAEMTCSHPDIDRRFDGRRWVADGKFPLSATRAEMEAALFAEVESHAAACLFTVAFPDTQESA